MTIESSVSREQYPTNGTTGPWTVPFYFLANADLAVIFTDASGNDTTLTLDADYSVSGAGVQSGGTVTTMQAYAAGGIITLYRNVEFTQETEFVDGDPQPAASMNAALDKLTMLVQQVRDLIGRCISFPESYDGMTEVGDVPTRKGKLLGFDAVTGAMMFVAGVAGTALDLALQYASAAGSALVGFIQAGLSAALRTLQSKVREIEVSAADFTGFDATSTTDSASAIQAAVNLCSSLGGGTVRIPSCLTSGWTMKSNVAHKIMHGDTVKLTPCAIGQLGVIVKGSGSIGKVRFFGGGTIDGQRFQPDSVTGPFTSTIYFPVGAGEDCSGIEFENIHFLNTQGDAVRIYATDITATGKKLRMTGCTAEIDDAHRFDSVALPIVDLIRIGQSGGAGGGADLAGGGYGMVNFTDIRITDCHAYQIRTLADLKRGCANFVVSNCTTRDMYDCHHSVDGSFYGELSNLPCYISTGTTIQNATFTNFLEIQGEHIGISNVMGFGGGKTNSGIFITDYGRDDEIVGGHQIGHQSFKVTVRNSDMDNILGVAYRIVSGQECVVANCEASLCGHPGGIEQGARYVADGSALITPAGNEISDINNKGTTGGVFIAATAIHSIYGPCYDQARNDNFYVPTTPGAATSFLAAEAYPGGGGGCADFRNKGPVSSLNRNSVMDLAGGALPNYWGSASSCTAAQVGGPVGVPKGVELTDAGAGAIRTLDSNAGVMLLQNEMVHFRFWLKQGASGAATKCGFRIQEYNAINVQLGTDYWYGTNSIPSTWTEYVFAHTAQDAACAYIAISIAPAASFAGDAALTGTTAFADVQWARHAIGQR